VLKQTSRLLLSIASTPAPSKTPNDSNWPQAARSIGEPEGSPSFTFEINGRIASIAAKADIRNL
jgi:hypothetical protein